jgi:hypothetical protein
VGHIGRIGARPLPNGLNGLNGRDGRSSKENGPKREIYGGNKCGYHYFQITGAQGSSAPPSTKAAEQASLPLATRTHGCDHFRSATWSRQSVSNQKSIQQSARIPQRTPSARKHGCLILVAATERRESTLRFLQHGSVNAHEFVALDYAASLEGRKAVHCGMCQ